MGGKADENNLIPIACSNNMGWQKQSKGFNSNTDKAAAMSLQTGKIMDFTTAPHTNMTAAKIIVLLQKLGNLQLLLNFLINYKTEC